MEQHQPNQTDHLRIDHWSGSWSCCSAGIRNLDFLGTMFVGALKGIAPLLVFFLVMSALCHMKSGQKTNLKFIIILYMVGNLVSAFVAVIACRLFPVTLTFTDTASATDITPPSGIAEVLTNLLNNLVKNPVDSIVNANYIGILFGQLFLELH